MELQFKKTACACLDTALREVQNSEQTQEVKLSDGMPDIGRILSSWGQVILRGKEWRRDSASFSGGVMVWTLYAPEDGSEARCIDSWIPFQMKWDLPEDVPEGKLRVICRLRNVDARSVSARKIMLRVGVAALAEAYVPMEAEYYLPESVPQELQLLHSTYPVVLQKEAGEKTFQMEETVTLPPSAPMPEQLIYYCLQPVVTDKKVLSEKLVFRGNGKLHFLYRSEEGQIHSWDTDVPFSQLAQLETPHSPDARADLSLELTGLELDLDDEGELHLKCGVAAQYVTEDKQKLELIEDAYAPGRELTVLREKLELPVVLEKRQENLYGEQTLPAEANLAADVMFLPDFPRQRRNDSGLELENSGVFNLLYYGEDSMLHGVSARWEDRQTVPAHEDSSLRAVPYAAQPQANLGNGQIVVKVDTPVDYLTSVRQPLHFVRGVELGEQRTPDPERPSLILRRAGEQRLWDVAKELGSTMEAIRSANHLTGEPAPDQMLLIPIP